MLNASMVNDVEIEFEESEAPLRESISGTGSTEYSPASVLISVYCKTISSRYGRTRSAEDTIYRHFYCVV